MRSQPGYRSLSQDLTLVQRSEVDAFLGETTGLCWPTSTLA
jgi:hypothetical protein